MKIRKILLTTDLSEEAERAFGPVAELALGTGALVTLLYVVPDLHVAPHGAPLAPPVSAPEVDDLVKEALGQIEAQRLNLPEELPVECDVARGEDPARAIAVYAHKHGHDLIALSSHGRTGFRRLILGSIAEAVMRHSDVPVLVFPKAKD
ncbi:MAG: universal stress protein [Planctomycetota bacterium]|nr:MAG: universal stress protein [Planctomycetota bacterium]